MPVAQSCVPSNSVFTSVMRGQQGFPQPMVIAAHPSGSSFFRFTTNLPEALLNGLARPFKTVSLQTQSQAVAQPGSPCLMSSAINDSEEAAPGDCACLLLEPQEKGHLVSTASQISSQRFARAAHGAFNTRQLKADLLSWIRHLLVSQMAPCIQAI